MVQASGFILATGAGVCAAGASIFAKLLFSVPETPSVVVGKDLGVLLASMDVWGQREVIEWLVLRLLWLLLVVLSNVLMVNCSSKALDLSKSSVVTVVTTTATNFFTSALSGQLLFGERLPLVWWGGASFLILGMILIHKSQQSPSSPSPSLIKNEAKKTR